MNPIPGSPAGLEPILEKVGRVLADQYGIRVVCQGARCCTDGKVIYLPSLPDDIPKDLMDAIRGYLDHETSHLLAASSFTAGAEFKRKHGAEAFGLLNSLEDLRVESVMCKRYPGSAFNLARAYDYAVTVSREQTDAGQPLPFMKQLAFAIYSRALGKPDLSFVEPHIHALASLIDREIHESVVAPNTRTVARLAESAWRTVSSYLNAIPKSPDPKSPDQTRPEEKRSAQTSPVSNNPTPPSGNNSNGSFATPPEKKRKKQSGNEDTKSAPSNKLDASLSASAGNKKSGNENGAGVIGGLGEEIAGAVSRYSTIAQAYRVWSTSHDTVSVVSDNSRRSHEDRMSALVPHVTGIRQRLHQTLLSEARVRWLPETEEGYLNPRALHRLTSARIVARQNTSSQTRGDASSLTKRVFRKRMVAKRLKTAVTLLVDLSHSMSTRKLDIARDTALVLCESMARLNISVEVIGFSTQTQGKILRDAAAETGIPADALEQQFRFAPLVHEIYKRFDEPFRRVSGRFESMRTHMMTPLGESMLFAARGLAMRPEPRKILLTLTDGRPTVGMGNDIATHNHAVDSIHRIERAGIDVCLIGILEACVRDLHHRSVVVDALENLPGVIMTQLQRLLSGTNRVAYRQAFGSAA